MFVPHLVVLVYEVTSFVFGMQIQRGRIVEMKARLQQAEKSITDVKEFAGRKGAKKRSTRQSSPESSDLRRSRSNNSSSFVSKTQTVE